MKYRYIYDYLFRSSEEITVGDKVITDLMIYVKFKVYHNGEEVFFVSDKGIPLVINGYSDRENRRISIEHIIRCVYNRESMFEFLPTPTLRYAESNGYKITYEVDSYGWGVKVNDCVTDGEYISKEKFEDIFRKYIDLFDCSDNYPAQSTYYYTEEVKL